MLYPVGRITYCGLVFGIAAVGCSSPSSGSVDSAVSNDASSVAAADAAGTSDAALAPASCPDKTYSKSYSATPDDTFEALRGVTNIDGDLRIERTTKVVDLSALSCLKTIRYTLIVSKNEALTSLRGLESLADVGSDVDIADNPSLDNMDGLANLATVGKNSLTFRFDIRDNAKLRSISLGRVTAIPGGVGINGNASISDLGGLRTLTSIARSLWITGNGSLKSLKGTEALTAVATKPAPNIGVPIIDLKISANSHLPQCDAKALLDRLTTNGFKGASEVSGNLGTCP